MLQIYNQQPCVSDLEQHWLFKARIVEIASVEDTIRKSKHVVAWQ